MVFTNWNTKAPNGRIVSATVELIEEDGKTRWRATGCVDGTSMAFSHHDLRSEAEAKAQRWHDAYLKVHS